MGREQGEGLSAFDKQLAQLEKIRVETGIDAIRELPATRMFKVNVKFTLE